MATATSTPAPFAGYHLHALQEAHTAVNRAFTAANFGEQTRIQDALAFTRDAHRRLQDAVAHDGPDAALAAAHAVLPRITRAVELLAALEADAAPERVRQLLDEYTAALDRLEETMDAAGWD